MRERSVGMKAFGLFQVILLLVIGATIYLFWRRKRDRERAAELRLDNVYLRGAIHRTAAHEAPKSAAPKENRKAPELESAFPEWSKDATAHEILGVHPQAPEHAIEAAYKKLLKRYHPDKFAHWGKGYQNRAHHVVLRLQQAREELLGGRKGGKSG
jgi:DnaJ-domain-containing protein 1